jgi:hypothetical protein
MKVTNFDKLERTQECDGHPDSETCAPRFFGFLTW